MDNFFKILSIILTILIIAAAALYFTNNIITWLYQPADNLSVIAIVSVVVALGLIIIINKINTIYELIIYINSTEDEDEHEEY